MKVSFLRSAVFVLFAPLLLSAFQATQRSVAISELGSHPFTAGALKITVTSFKGSAVFATKLE